MFFRGGNQGIFGLQINFVSRHVPCPSIGPKLILTDQNCFGQDQTFWICSGVDTGGAGAARAPPELWGSEKGQSLFSAYRSLAITASTSGFEKLSMALQCAIQ